MRSTTAGQFGACRSNDWRPTGVPDSPYDHSAADGSPAGKISLGEHWHVMTEPAWQERLDWGFTFHPSGKSVAVLAMGKNSYQTLVAHYNMASGRVLEQFELPAVEYEQLQAYYGSHCRSRSQDVGRLPGGSHQTASSFHQSKLRKCDLGGSSCASKASTQESSGGAT